MKKLGIILDSFSGYTKKEINKLNMEMVSQTIIIDGHPYLEGDTINPTNFKELLENAHDIKTSMPSIGIVVNKITEMSKKYENVIYFPMNKNISSTYSTGVANTSDLKNVHVVDVKLFGSMIPLVAKECMKMAEDGKDIKEILEFIQKQSNESHAYIIPKTVKAIIKSGRINGAKKIILEKVKLIPRLHLCSDGFKLTGTKRNFTKMINNTIERIIGDINEKNISKYEWLLIKTGDDNSNEIVRKSMNSVGIKKILESYGGIASISHIGIGGIGIGAMLKINN